MKNLSSTRQQERGSILVIGMLTLVVLSLVGVSATNTSTIESGISGNDKAQKETFFATELGLTVAEAALESLPSRPDFNEDTIVGHYAKNTQPDWHDLNWDNTDTIEAPASSMPPSLQVAERPRYTLEERRFQRDSLTTGIGVPTGIYYFNVTTRGVGATNTAKEVLRTIYAKRFN
jgi:type IV pilus assembly protein PilX